MANPYYKVRERPELASRLALANRVLTVLGYVAYPTLLVLLALFDLPLLARSIAVPAAAFVTVSIFRRLYNAPRPYEQPDRPALIPKSTRGKSFPSRHTFCMFMIAFSWMTWAPFWWVGLLLAACAAFMAWTRVALGVHHVRDVVAGFLAAALFAVVGYVIVPLAAG